MPSILFFLFVMWIIISAFMQAEDNPKKSLISPGLTAFCGVLVLTGTIMGETPVRSGITLAAALILLALSDLMFERSSQNDGLFPVAMVFGVLSGFTIGILFNLTAFNKGIPLWWWTFAALFAVLLTIYMFRFLKVESAQKVPVYIYLVQAVVLLTGGLSSLYTQNYAFAVWGIFIYISDTLVGIRAFPSIERPIRWLNARRILFLIIVIYYSAQYALVSWAL